MISVRDQAILATACPSAPGDDEEVDFVSRFFAPAIARKIKASDHEITAGTGEVRQAAIVNLDMRGFTLLAARESAGTM